MRWFWGVAAVLIGTLAGMALGFATISAFHGPFDVLLIASLSASGLSVLVCALSLVAAPATPSEPEARCRKCRYILRGLSEPRCPECGERI